MKLKLCNWNVRKYENWTIGMSESRMPDFFDSKSRQCGQLELAQNGRVGLADSFNRADFTFACPVSASSGAQVIASVWIYVHCSSEWLRRGNQSTTQILSVSSTSCCIARSKGIQRQGQANRLLSAVRNLPGAKQLLLCLSLSLSLHRRLHESSLRILCGFYMWLMYVHVSLHLSRIHHQHSPKSRSITLNREAQNSEPWNDRYRISQSYNILIYYIQ